MKHLLLLAMLLCWATCSLPTDQAKAPVVHTAYSLGQFIKAEQARLAQLPGPFVKTVQVDDQTETKELEQLDWANELEIFAKADINKPAWRGKYIVDSLFAPDGSLKALHYQAQDKKLKIRTFNVYFHQGQVDYIEIKKQANSLVSSATVYMKYDPDTGYYIENQQKTALSSPHILRISVTFVNKSR